jgi:prephenate dehydrogenase
MSSEHIDTSGNVLVIGSGLIGTSVALGLTAQGRKVFLSDIDPAALTSAVQVSGAKPFKNESITLVVVATPPAKVAAVMHQAAIDHPGAVITDVASVKVAIFNELHDLGTTAWDRIVGGHPMAGREVSGAVGAQGNLFLDRPWVLSTTPETTDAAIESVKEMVKALGAFPVARTVEEHDQAVALISHTPQVVATVLAGELMDAESSQIELAGQGIRDTIRIAGSDAALWTEILSENSDYVATRVTHVAESLLEFAAALNSGDRQAITDKLDRGSKGRDRLPGKHGATSQRTAVLAVRLDDKPGELARLFTVAAQAQVNLEDVRIDHSLGHPTGLVELSVTPAAIPKLETALVAANFLVIS